MCMHRASQHVNWTKLMHILKGNGINWHERRLNSKLYATWIRVLKLKLDQNTRSVDSGTALTLWCCHPLYSTCEANTISWIFFYFVLYTHTHIKLNHITEATERFGDFKLGQVLHAVKPAYELALLTEEEAALRGMLDRQIEIERGYGMETNVEKPKVMRV